MGAVWPLPPFSLQITGPSTLPTLGFVFVVRWGRPLSLQVHAKKEKMCRSERNLDLKQSHSQYIYRFFKSQGCRRSALRQGPPEMELMIPIGGRSLGCSSLLSGSGCGRALGRSSLPSGQRRMNLSSQPRRMSSSISSRNWMHSSVSWPWSQW